MGAVSAVLVCTSHSVINNQQFCILWFHMCLDFVIVFEILLAACDVV